MAVHEELLRTNRGIDMETISVRVPWNLRIDFKTACAEAGDTQTAVIRDAIEAYVAHFPRKADFSSIISDESVAKLKDQARRRHMTVPGLAGMIIDTWLDEHTWLEDEDDT